jgi:large subunit ribosomal protein L18
MAKNDPKKARLRRKRSIRSKVSGSPERPRLTVFRSNQHIYAQVIDDTNRTSLAATSTLAKGLEKELKDCKSKVERAQVVGTAIAKLCKDKGIEQVVFDRNGYIYHGRVSALASAAREAGLTF